MWESEKELVFQSARKMVEDGLIIGSQGNVSIRFTDAKGKQLIAITPTNIDYHFMKPGDIVILDTNGKQLAGQLKPSVETELHLNIYSTRPDVNAIVHTHSEFASMVSIMGLTIPPILDDQVIYLGGEIPVSGHAIPGTKKLADNVSSALGKANAVIMANHGALAVGIDMNKALFNSRLLEKLAKVFVYATLSGKIQKLPPLEVEKEIELFNSGGGEVAEKANQD